jgi:hypothetical protein
MDLSALAEALAHRALHLGMSAVADQHHPGPLAAVAGDLQVHLGHQGAGRIEDPQPARLRLVADIAGDPVGAEDHGPAGRHLIELVDEDRAAPLQAVDDETVVDHLVADIDGCAVDVEHPLDDLDRPIDTGAEAAGVGE